MSNPMNGFFAAGADRHLRFGKVGELYCHSEILVRKRADVDRFDWNHVDLDAIVGGTRYPAP